MTPPGGARSPQALELTPRTAEKDRADIVALSALPDATWAIG